MISMVPGDATRPIGGRAKEALFDIIGEDIRGATLLDLFSGTGSVGAEAISRGASRAVLVDVHRLAIKTIESNLTRIGLADRADVIHGDALEYLSAEPLRRFDYIFIAPPQYQGTWEVSLLCLDENIGWLDDDGWAVAQIDPSEYKKLELGQLEMFDLRRYGNTMLCFYGLGKNGSDYDF